MDMLHKLLCWIGHHEMVSYVITESEYSRLLGHRCKRCYKVAFGQEGIAEMVRAMAARQDNFIIDVQPIPFTIVDETNETRH